MINKTLKQLGFSEQEAQVYTTLLANSPAGASLLADKCGLSRSTVYTILDRLISEGLIGVTYKNEVKQFIAHGHSALEQKLEKEKDSLNNKFKLLDNIKTNLEILTKDDLNIPQVMFFEGQEGLKKIYSSMMRQAPNNAEMYILRDEFVWDKNWDFIFNKEWHEKIKKIKSEKNITTKLLVNSSKLEKSKDEFYKTKKNLEVKYLPTKNSINKFALYLINDMVSILSIENNNFIGIKMTNLHLSKNFKNIFDVLWNKSSK